jgi:hypothetical protein
LGNQYKWPGFVHGSRGRNQSITNNSTLNEQTMENIYNCKKNETSITMVWRERIQENEERFSFPELEAMRIPIQGLLDNPELFRIDLHEHKIYRNQVGRSSY